MYSIYCPCYLLNFLCFYCLNFPLQKWKLTFTLLFNNSIFYFSWLRCFEGDRSDNHLIYKTIFHPLYLQLWIFVAFYFTNFYLAAAAKSLQSCLTLCDPTDGSPPDSTVPGILQARTVEWVAISFSNAWKGKGKVKSFSRVQLLVNPWTAAYQAPPSMGFSRQQYRSVLPLPSPISVLDDNKYI